MIVSSESLMKRESNPGDPKSEMERKIKESGTRPLPVNRADVPANQVSISSTLNVRIFCTNVNLAAFSSYVLALAKNSYKNTRI
jgi:hypothetical protein